MSTGISQPRPSDRPWLTTLPCSNALYTYEQLRLIDIKSAIGEASQRHETRQRPGVLAVEGPLELSAVVTILMFHKVTVTFTLWENGGEDWRRVGSKCVVLRAVRDMHCPDCDELPKTQFILRVSIPESHGEYTGVVGKHDLDITLCRFVTFAWDGNIVEVDYATHERQVARSRLERPQVSFFILESGLLQSV